MRSQLLFAFLLAVSVTAAPLTDSRDGETDSHKPTLQLRAPKGLRVTPKVLPKAPPRITAPKLPKAAPPKLPKIAPPKVPKVPAPKIPKVTAPKIPKVTAPKVPKVTAPKVPKVTAPKVPKVAAPKVPKVTTPKVPKVTTPKVPKVTTPKVPKVTTPKVPKVTAPKTPKVTTPKTPKTPKAVAGKTPAGKTPAAPASKCKRADKACELPGAGAPPPPPPPPPPPGSAAAGKKPIPPRPATPPAAGGLAPNSVVKIGGQDVNIGAAIDKGKVFRGTFGGQPAVIKNSLDKGEIEKTKAASDALGNGFFLHSGKGTDGKDVLVTKQLSTKNIADHIQQKGLKSDPKKCQEALQKATEAASQAQLKLAKGAGFVQGDDNFENFFFNDDFTHADVIDFGKTIPVSKTVDSNTLLASQRKNLGSSTFNPATFGC